MPTILTSDPAEESSLGSDRLHSSISVRASLESLVPAPYTPDAVIGWHPVLSGDCRTFPSWRQQLMDVAQDVAAESGERTGGNGAEEERETGEPSPDGAVQEEAMMALPEEEKKSGEGPDNGGTNPDTDVTDPDPTDPDPTKTSPENNEKPPEPAKSSLDKELEALLASCSDPPPPDVLMIQSENAGMVDIVQVEQNADDPAVTEKKAPPPPLRPPTTWTSANIREFKHRMASEKHGMLTVRRGEVMTVRVPTHPEGKRLCWEFATEDYDIGFGIYFDWTSVTSTAVTIQVSESSDDEEEEETESPWHSREGDVERGSVYRLRSRYGEIMQVFRRDSHREVQAGSHDYPGEGVYLLKLDNSYSLLRNKTLYFHVYYSS